MLEMSATAGIARAERVAARAAALVVVHTHALLPFFPVTYMVRELMPYWRRMGIAAVCVPAAVHVASADVAVMHVDCSRPVLEYAALAERYGTALNAGVGSIEKRAISRHLVQRGDGYAGPIIVKTNGNFGGAIDYQITRESHSLRTCVRAIRQRMPWQYRSRLEGKDYRVFRSAAEVPRAAWRNRDLVVERLRCERADDLYVLRSWVFFGDRGFISVNYATTPVVHARTIVTRKLEFEPPAALVAMRQAMRFDFGKFDYTIVDGTVHLLDANTTPTVGNFSKWPWFGECMERVAGGIAGYL
jgi:hypothetical protein